jgi:hypothetical protein
MTSDGGVVVGGVVVGGVVVGGVVVGGVVVGGVVVGGVVGTALQAPNKGTAIRASIKTIISILFFIS